MTVTDLTKGTVLRGSSRTITDVELAMLPALMGAINPLFHDEVSARAGRMGGRILFGPALLGIALASTEPFLSDRVAGLLGMTDVVFRRPVRLGDTVTATLTVADVQARSNGRGAVLAAMDEVHNQDGELVLSFQRSILLKDETA